MVKSLSMMSERDVNGVVTVWRTVQHTDEQEVGAEGRSQSNKRWEQRGRSQSKVRSVQGQ